MDSSNHREHVTLDASTSFAISPAIEQALTTGTGSNRDVLDGNGATRSPAAESRTLI